MQLPKLPMQLKPIEQSFTVAYEYKLHFTQQLFHLENPLLKDLLEDYKKEGQVKLLFVVDEGVVKKHSTLVKSIKRYCGHFPENLQHTATIIIPGGEACKNDSEQLAIVLKAINDEHIDRHSFVVAIGGGALIDMAGYAAAIAHRGVRLIRIPTTVLSQNDAAVGVKNSVNTFEKKNFLGTFATPYAIINDSDFLTTLDQRDWIAGISEAIKVALIKDRTFFEYIEANALKLKQRDIPSMQYLIYRCAEMHMQHIAKGGDPFESGSSRPLDFGHWAAHKMEQMTRYSLRHGEAVAKGIALDLTYSYLIGLLPKQVWERIIGVMERIEFDLQIPVKADSDEMDILLLGIQEFQEHLGGGLCITLISDIGAKQDVNKIDYTLMKQAVNVLNKKVQ